jgi:hypothetical protein
MAVQLKKKSAARSGGRRPPANEAQARERYREIVQAKAVDDVDPDMRDIHDLQYWIEGLSDKKFKADVRSHLKDRERMAELHELDTAQLAELERQAEEMGELQSRLDDENARAGIIKALSRMVEDADFFYKSKTNELESAASAIGGIVCRVAHAGSVTRLAQFRQQRMQLSKRLPWLLRAIAEQRRMKELLVRERENFDDWRQSRPMRHAVTDKSGRMLLPLWHPSGGNWGRPVEPAAAAVREADTALRRLEAHYKGEDKTAELEQTRKQLADLAEKAATIWQSILTH